MSVLATWRDTGGLQIRTLSGNIIMALLSVWLLTRHDPKFVAALVVVVFVLHQGYMGRRRAHEEREAGKRKSVAIGKLTADLDEPAVIRRAAEEAVILTKAEVVEVEVRNVQDERHTLHRLYRDASEWVGDSELAPAIQEQLVATVPIGAEHRILGELRIWLAAGTAGIGLSQADREAVAILAATTCAALANARAHAEQVRLATTDRATCLPIRSVLFERVEASVYERRGGEFPPVALILIDITGFRGVVTALGHDAAEDLLAHVGCQLKSAAEGDEVVAFVGGDDFGVYLPDAVSPAHVSARALALLDSVTAPLHLPVGPVTLNAAAGIAYCGTPVASGRELLRQATVALGQARSAFLRVHFYEPEADLFGGPRAVVMASELHDALARDGLELHYQPMVHLPSGAPVGIEALARWVHPTKGLLMAREFMPVLERSGDHAAFVTWQLEEALRTRAGWGVDRDLPVSVNIAARCLLDTTFPHLVAGLLHSCGVSADQLMVELAETSTLTESDTAKQVLDELQAMGVRIAIDGFGTGYSSLLGFLDVPASHLKVGADFVEAMLEDDRAAGIVKIAVELGRQSGLKVVALGVSSGECADALAAAGCDLAQGRYLARPMLPAEVKAYLEEAPALPAETPAEVIHMGNWLRRTRPTV